MIFKNLKEFKGIKDKKYGINFVWITFRSAMIAHLELLHDEKHSFMKYSFQIFFKHEFDNWLLNP